MKILIIGHARHGKDTLAEFLKKHYDLSFTSSSERASEIFIFDKLKDKYGYRNYEECFKDRVNRRTEWHDLICEYNTPNKAKLAKDILETNDMYVGMRSEEEYQECKRQNLFDWVVGVFDPRKPLEDKSSFNIDLWKSSDFVICNSSTLESFENKTVRIFNRIM